MFWCKNNEQILSIIHFVCSTLPDTLLGNTALLQMYSYYRQILGDTLLRDRLDLESTGMDFNSPVFKAFSWYLKSGQEIRGVSE